MNQLRNSILASALLAFPYAHGTVLLYEPFDYTSGAILGKSGATETGFDTSSTWLDNSAQTTEIQAGSMNFGTLGTTGNRFHYNSGGTELNRVVYRGMNITAASGDLYLSFLMQGPNGLRLNGGVVVSHINNWEFGTLRSKQNSTTNTPAGTVNPSLIYGTGGTTQTMQASANVVSSTNYMYVQHLTGLGTASGGTSRLWIIAEAQYNTIALDGLVTPAELDANSHTSTPLLTLTGAAPTLEGNETLRIVVHDNGSGATDFNVDEIRIATTLGEAMSIVPEPSAILLATFGALLGLKRRRRNT